MSTISKIKVGGTTYDIAYPVGSIYLSVNNTSPAALFGGTWEQIKDCFLLAAGDTYTAGSTGGEAQHTLTVDEMPTHRHALVQDITTEVERDDTIVDDKSMGFGRASSIGDNKRYWKSNTDSKGGGSSHNNMPPYLAVYMWKRIA